MNKSSYHRRSPTLLDGPSHAMMAMGKVSISSFLLSSSILSLATTTATSDDNVFNSNKQQLKESRKNKPSKPKKLRMRMGIIRSQRSQEQEYTIPLLSRSDLKVIRFSKTAVSTRPAKRGQKRYERTDGLFAIPEDEIAAAPSATMGDEVKAEIHSVEMNWRIDPSRKVRPRSSVARKKESLESQHSPPFAYYAAVWLLMELDAFSPCK